MVSSTQQRNAQPWRSRYERLWREAGNPPRPQVSRMGSPADVAAREWAAFVASGRPGRAVRG